MEAITGVFQTRSEAERALREVQNAGVDADRVTLLVPGSVDQVEKEVRSVPTDSTEQPGMGNAMGALLGGGIGITGGSVLMALVPGLGPVTALGLLGAGILGAAGASVGAVIGSKAEKSTIEGLPEDEIFVYEDALRKGRSVVVALVENQGSESLVRDLLKRNGAETVDDAREQWWTGLRSAEKGHYDGAMQKAGQSPARNFTDDEKFYRLGFEAALHARTRCMEFDQVSAEMDAALEEVKRQYPGQQVDDAFTRGYQRGREYYQHLCDESNKAA